MHNLILCCPPPVPACLYLMHWTYVRVSDVTWKSQKVLFRGVGGVDFAPARLSLGTSSNCRGLEESWRVLEESVAMVGPGRFQAQKYTLHQDDLQDLEKI